MVIEFALGHQPLNLVRINGAVSLQVFDFYGFIGFGLAQVSSALCATEFCGTFQSSASTRIRPTSLPQLRICGGKVWLKNEAVNFGR